MFEIQKQIFGDVKVITKVGEPLPEVEFISGFGNIEESIRKYQPDMLHINIDFSEIKAKIAQGTLGVKVWIYRGEIFEDEKNRRGGHTN